MLRTPGKPELILFHEVTPATVLKALNESAEATTGGGARDIRLRPHSVFGPFMDRLLTGTGTRSRPGGGTATVRTGTATWGNGSVTREIEYWPPTTARPGEGRIARISALPPLANPPEVLGGSVFLFVRDENGLIWVRYASAEGLRESLPEVGDRIRECLERVASKKIATGYIDLTPNGLGNWCNA